jgi:hypothetical protein
MNKQPLDFSVLFTPKEASRRLKVSSSWLAKARMGLIASHILEKWLLFGLSLTCGRLIAFLLPRCQRQRISLPCRNDCRR